jgi:hypothetical protein
MKIVSGCFKGGRDEFFLHSLLGGQLVKGMIANYSLKVKIMGLTCSRLCYDILFWYF